MCYNNDFTNTHEPETLILRPYQCYCNISMPVVYFYPYIDSFEYYQKTYSYNTLKNIERYGYILFTTSNGILHYIHLLEDKEKINKVSNETAFESLLSGITGYSIKIIRNKNDLDKLNKEKQEYFNYTPPAPMVSTPMVSTPMAPAPMAPAPMAPTPMVSTPMVSTPMVSAPMVSAPMAPAPMAPAPMAPTPMVSAPMVSAPMVSAPMAPAQYQMPPSQPICIMDLPILLENEQFFPYSNTKYLNIDGVKTYCKNLFTPTQYLNQLYENNQNVTCPPYIQNYISYLASNKKEYFNLIMCYLYFIMLPLYIHRQDLATCQLALVIVGGNKSGKEILFNNIIKPILGEKYCLDVDDNLLSKKDYKKEFDNKIFYNFSNLTSKSLANKEKKKLIENILSNKSIMINDNAINTCDKFKIVMLESEYLPYNLPENYYVLKAPNDIENSSYDSLKNISLLENKIEEELPDFMNYIVNYYIKETMDFPQNEIKLISNVTDEKIVQIFSNYLLENHIPTALKENIKLQEEKIKKMEHLYNKFHKVSRPNIHELFKAKFPEHAKTINANFLYKELEKCNPQVLKLTDGYQGDKCFEILKYL